MCVSKVTVNNFFLAKANAYVVHLDKFKKKKRPYLHIKDSTLLAKRPVSPGTFFNAFGRDFYCQVYWTLAFLQACCILLVQQNCTN